MPKVSRQETISGTDQYIKLTDQEKASHYLEIFVAFTRSPTFPYLNLKWYKRQGIFARFTFWRDNFVLQEKVAKYANERIYFESAPNLEKVTSDLCKQINDALRSDGETDDRFSRDTGIAAVTSGVDTVEGALAAQRIFYRTRSPAWLSGRKTNYAVVPGTNEWYWFQPRAAIGLAIEGIGYSCEGGVEGQITIQSWFESICTIPGTNTPSVIDERGRPPATSSDNPPAGGIGGAASTPPTGSDDPPPPGQIVPPSSLDPGGFRPPQGPLPPAPPTPGQEVGSVYEISGTWAATGNNGAGSYRVVLTGRIGPMVKRFSTVFPTSFAWGFDYGQGTAEFGFLQTGSIGDTQNGPQFEPDKPTQVIVKLSGPQ